METDAHSHTNVQQRHTHTHKHTLLQQQGQHVSMAISYILSVYIRKHTFYAQDKISDVTFWNRANIETCEYAARICIVVCLSKNLKTFTADSGNSGSLFHEYAGKTIKNWIHPATRGPSEES